jgi:hypothetical protein
MVYVLWNICACFKLKHVSKGNTIWAPFDSGMSRFRFTTVIRKFGDEIPVDKLTNKFQLWHFGVRQFLKPYLSLRYCEVCRI